MAIKQAASFIYISYCSLKFTVFATNGGYVAVYNRENNDRIDKYIVTGETTTRSFEIKFDLEKPEHCIMDSAGCSTQPITLQDLTEKVFEDQ